jgi:Response regulator containing CheY-like receiver, AAA-type ATPase, and DNA-binding domains
MEIQSIKQRFDIIGDDPQLNRALDIAIQVANTDLSVLVTGESGVGKEAIPQIIHQNSPRKHNVYIAVNCGAIPEGTIDSELFGHEKGSFTGANETRKGYFEVADKGTIFLDEVAELPLSTQVRLLRILQSGEFYKVGSSKVQKTDVRVVAATNKNLQYLISSGKFREDLYYRLNTVPITIPALRERKNDIYLLFRKFALDFADKYKMPSIKLDHNAQILLQQYRWPGNIRQLKNVAEQMSVLENEREINAETLSKYLPADSPERLPVLNNPTQKSDFISDRDLFYSILLKQKQEIESLKSEIENLKGNIKASSVQNNMPVAVDSYALHHREKPVEDYSFFSTIEPIDKKENVESSEDDSLSIPDLNNELIKRCLEKHNGKRKEAAQELGISERTLYRKIKAIYNNEKSDK